MNDELHELQQAYRNIKAPPFLATRIHAALKPAGKVSHQWLPGAVSAAVLAVTLLWFLPQTMQSQSAQQITLSAPSLSRLALIMNQNPTLRSPDFSRLHSVKIPPLPRPPQHKAAEQPQGFFPKQKDRLKEFYNA